MIWRENVVRKFFFLMEWKWTILVCYDFLGSEGQYSDRGFFVHHEKYIKDLIQIAKFADKKSSFGIECQKLERGWRKLADHLAYHQLVGWLIYLTMTCSDIVDAVSLVSQLCLTLESSSLLIFIILGFLKIHSIFETHISEVFSSHQFIHFSQCLCWCWLGLLLWDTWIYHGAVSVFERFI